MIAKAVEPRFPFPWPKQWCKVPDLIFVLALNTSGLRLSWTTMNFTNDFHSAAADSTLDSHIEKVLIRERSIVAKKLE